MYFIPVLNLLFLQNSDVGIALGCINMAVEYRELFLSPESEMCLLAFRRNYDFGELTEKVMKLVREVTLIEDRARILDLNRQ